MLLIKTWNRKELQVRHKISSQYNMWWWMKIKCSLQIKNYIKTTTSFTNLMLVRCWTGIIIVERRAALSNLTWYLYRKESFKRLRVPRTLNRNLISTIYHRITSSWVHETSKLAVWPLAPLALSRCWPSNLIKYRQENQVLPATVLHPNSCESRIPTCKNWLQLITKEWL